MATTEDDSKLDFATSSRITSSW